MPTGTLDEAREWELNAYLNEDWLVECEYCHKPYKEDELKEVYCIIEEKHFNACENCIQDNIITE